MIYTISNGDITAKIASNGAELISVNMNGTELMWQSPSDEFWSKHSPLLFPVCGRLKDSCYTYQGKRYDMTSHGFISRCEFEAAEISGSSITLTKSYDEDTLSIYPFPFRFSVRYIVTDKGVASRVMIENLGSEEMPFMFGWHPAFALMCNGEADINDYKICFDGAPDTILWTPLQNVCFANPTKKPYKTDNGAYTLSEEEIYKNDTMIFSGIPTKVLLCSDKTTHSVSLSWSENTPNLCIWKHPDNRAKFICIEPWSNLPEGGVRDEHFEDKNMLRLPVGAKEEFLFSFEFSL